MDKKKGNTIIIMLVFVFFVSAFIGCFILINNVTTKKLNEFISSSQNNRFLELKVYEFYLSKELEDEEFIVDGNLIYIKKIQNIYFEVITENNVIGIRKEVIE